MRLGQASIGPRFSYQGTDRLPFSPGSYSAYLQLGKLGRARKAWHREPKRVIVRCERVLGETSSMRDITHTHTRAHTTYIRTNTHTHTDAHIHTYVWHGWPLAEEPAKQGGWVGARDDSTIGRCRGCERQ